MKLDENHKLYKLTSLMDWAQLEAEIRKTYDLSSTYSCRFVVGVLYLKSINQLSALKTIEEWERDPYWRYFCGVMPSKQTEPFPHSPYLLDIWDREFAGDGYDAMIRALMRSMSGVRVPGAAKQSLKASNQPWFNAEMKGFAI